ncbi:MAG: hypothetical protein LUI14_07750 [Lachnospiraceae bacterium]|nr:hypothetical protein [Lachnospiraceae bacterium]MCD7765743.1 hypothetical protein [Lachnospiraceae bacterium]
MKNPKSRPKSDPENSPESNSKSNPAGSRTGKAGINWRHILMLQVIVFVYSMISMLSKQVSSLISANGLFSWQTICGVGGVFLALAIYAFFWQKILKKVDLSVAYANKAVGLLWTLLWSSLMFQEKISAGNVLGLVIICAGVLVVTGNE